MTYLDVVLDTAPVVVDVAPGTAVVWVDVQAAGGPPGPEGSPGPPGPAGPAGDSHVPAAPTGELGGTWAATTVDPVHAGSSAGSSHDTAVQQALAGASLNTAIAISDHQGAADPHPTYLTAAEGATAYATTVANVVIDGGGSVITTGVKGAVKITAPSTLTAWEVVSVDNTTGSIVVELWVDTYANWPPVAGDILGSAEKPTLASQTKNQDVSLNGGAGYPIAGGAWLIWNVASASAVKIVTVALSLART